MKKIWVHLIVFLGLVASSNAHPEVIVGNSFVIMEGEYSFAGGTRELKISVEREVIKYRVKFIRSEGFTTSSSSMKLLEGHPEWFAYISGEDVWIYNGKSHFFVVRSGSVKTEGRLVPTFGGYGVDKVLAKEVPEVIRKRIPDVISKIEESL